MDAKQQKILGIGLMLPAAFLGVYLILNVKFWVIGILAIIFTALAMFGWHLFKGMSIKDAANEVVDVVKKD